MLTLDPGHWAASYIPKACNSIEYALPSFENGFRAGF